MSSPELGLSRCSISARRRKQNAITGCFSSIDMAVTSRRRSSNIAIPIEYSSHCFRLTPLTAFSRSTLACTHLWQPRLIIMQKSDFLSLSWAAYTSAFTANNILSSFRASGIHPREPDVVMKRFKTPPSRADTNT
ncbi:hypothetical protein GGP41_004498 [Bipolaris sorokiniana]|uniref:Uncharacterized protein n=1 Tax=Cochliobolus sativus TaxID=45130 RepID=A0A8H5Z7S4_COCSA|nr:hypothetical protein GGP41_004498 [Bipolaris sorokiniana]